MACIVAQMSSCISVICVWTSSSWVVVATSGKGIALVPLDLLIASCLFVFVRSRSGSGAITEPDKGGAAMRKMWGLTADTSGPQIATGHGVTGAADTTSHLVLGHTVMEYVAHMGTYCHGICGTHGQHAFFAVCSAILRCNASCRPHADTGATVPEKALRVRLVAAISTLRAAIPQQKKSRLLRRGRLARARRCRYRSRPGW